MRNGTKLIIMIIVVVCIAAVVVFWPRKYESTFFPMGGIPFKVVIYDRDMLEFDDDLEKVEDHVGELERVFNRYDKSSELAKINEKAAVTPMVMSSQMKGAFDLSQRWFRATGGAFDPTVAPITDIWKRAQKEGEVPSADAIREARSLVGFDKIATASGNKMLFGRPGMELDFGAIAKGIIVDASVCILKKNGVTRGIVEGGGDAFAFGEGTFLFGIADPTSSDPKKVMGTLEVSNGAVVTSGDYQRYFTIDGKRYSHIINPRTGAPVDNELASATIVGGSAADADALATAVTVMGLKGGMGLLEGFPDYSAVLIAREEGRYRVYVSKSIAGRLSLAQGWEGRVTEF